MRIILFFLFLSLMVRAEDWTVGGKDYRNVKVLKVEADAITILDSDGGARLNLSDLTLGLQKRFHYDPATAKAAADERARSDAESAAALQQEMNQATEVQNQRQVDAAAQIAEARKAAQKTYAQTFSSHGGTAPVPVDNSQSLAAENEIDQKEWEKGQIIKKQDEATGYSHSFGRVLQVLPDGFIASNVATRWGIYNLAFIQTDTKNMIDDQGWTGIIIPQNTYQYTNAMGTLATIPAFTTDLKEIPSQPATSNYTAPPRVVNSLQAVGGG
ncbi:MAG: hypothetical protein LV480_00920 [Methylacidiphilales bacterium]|nr:hypothetical protein [Candidatus Methylacidiphilales bacterium]